MSAPLSQVLSELLAGGAAPEDLQGLQKAFAERGHTASLGEIWWHLEALREGTEEGSAPGRPRLRHHENLDHRELTTVGPAIRRLRGDRTQCELADQAGIDRASWSLYEAGKRQPGPEALAKIIRALGCSRLTFEETLWDHRRRYLLRQEVQAAASRRRSEHQGSTALYVRQLQAEPVEVAGDLQRQVLWNLFSRLADLVEEVAGLMARTLAIALVPETRPAADSQPLAEGRRPAGELDQAAPRRREDGNE